MSKGLEALERLYCAGNLELNYVLSDKHIQDFELIHKSLRALEIIIEKKVDVQMLYDRKNLNEYNWCVHEQVRALTQEEYDLLKEELE